MNRYIIRYGWHGTAREWWADSLSCADAEATCRSIQLGLLDDDLSDTTSAEPYTNEKAEEYGLLPAYEPLPVWLDNHVGG